ncbi:retrotransposon ty1-copia subclass, partial [Lasius niger]
MDEAEQTPRKYKNPRLPIPRSPYPKRKGSRSSDNDEHEQAIIAETFMASSEPATVQDALKAEDSDKWREAMKSELDSLMENQTWTLVPRPT